MEARLGIIVLAIALLVQLKQCDATLFQNFARDLARNQMLHILRHHPDLINEIIRLQQQQQQQLQILQQQQQQQNMGINQNGINPTNGQQGLGGLAVMGGNDFNPTQGNVEAEIQAQTQTHLQAVRQQQSNQQSNGYLQNDFIRPTNRFPNQRFI